MVIWKFETIKFKSGISEFSVLFGGHGIIEAQF
jgi:hypothetical protein